MLISKRSFASVIAIVLLLLSIEGRSQAVISLVAKKFYNPIRYVIADTTPAVGTFIRVPGKIPVVAGSAGQKFALLKLTNANGNEFYLYYKGNADNDDARKGNRNDGNYYVFDKARNGNTSIKPNDLMEVGNILLQVLDGKKGSGTTIIKLDVLPLPLSIAPNICNPQPTSSCCNLVVNGDFESRTSDVNGNLRCPTALAQINYACSWGSPTNGTPDYYNGCNAGTTVGIPINSHAANIDSYLSKGKGYAGFWAASNSTLTPTYEYIHQEIAPLTKDKFYYVEMYVRLSDLSLLEVDRLSIAFSPSLSTTNGAMITPLPSILITGYTDKAKGNWQKISGCFQATQSNLTQLTIGNFYAGTKPVNPSEPSRTKTDAYYFVDNVSLIELPDPQTFNKSVSCGLPVSLGNDPACMSSSCAAAYGITYAWTASPADPSLVSQENSKNPSVRPLVSTVYTLVTTYPTGKLPNGDPILPSCSVTTTVNVTVTGTCPPSCFNSNLIPKWATYFGGKNLDNIFSMAFTPSGNIVVYGNTNAKTQELPSTLGTIITTIGSMGT